MLQLFKPHKISVPHWKNTEKSQTEHFTNPPVVHLMLSQHIGAPGAPTVKVGETVAVGQVIAESSARVSAPIHASVSGVIDAIDDTKIVIKSDGENKVHESIQPPVINSDEDFINAVQSSGLVGLGGAGFPSFIKFDIKAEQQVDTLIINAAECEPFIASDTREMIENTADVLEGAMAVANYLEVSKVIIGIEDHNKGAIKALTAGIQSNDAYKKFEIKVLPSKYPQGAEKVLVASCTGRVVPLGKLPQHVGVVVSNVSSIGFLGRYLKTGIPLVTRRITLDGGAIKSPANIMAPIGTLVSDLVEFAGGYASPPAKILSGGPMMGTPLDSEDSPITKRTNAVTIFNQIEAIEQEELECIRCARCIDVCPVNLLPTTIDANVRIKNIDALQKLDLNACIDCGLCSFSCPSNRTLVQNIRVGKGMLKALEQGGNA